MAPGPDPDVRAGTPEQTWTFDCPRVFASGQVIAGRYRISRFIARGGMGEVYEAYDGKLGLPVALKTLRRELSRDADALSRFRREIRLAREVAHENLCRVYDLVEHGIPQPRGGDAVISCLTMELLEGEILGEYIARTRPLQPGQALHIISQIAAALDHLHSHGIVHRDLKPSNVMLTRTAAGAPRAILMDFGLAKPAEEASEQFETVGGAAGTPYFMAPEVLRGERPTPASDIYALGLLIDEMVTRSRAFPAASTELLYAQKLERGPSPPSQRTSNLPPGWESTILRCLEGDPSRRFRSAAAVRNALSSDRGTGAAPDASTASITATARRRSIRTRTLAALFVCILVLILASIALVSRPLGVSIVVFQTANFTERPEYAYLCTGMWAELIRRLSQIRGLSVKPYYEPRGKATPPDIHAGFLLDSQLEEGGGRIRFAARLIQQRDGRVVWADAVDRELGDPLETQSYVARHIVEALDKQALFGDTNGAGSRAFASVLLALRRALGFQALPRPPTTSSAALDAYMLGRHLWEQRTTPASLAAIKHFERALKADPDFALAYSALADVYLVLVQDNYAPAVELLARAEENASKGVAIGPDLAETHLSLAAVRQHLWDWHAAEESYRTAIGIRPDLGRAHLWYAGLMLQLGRIQETLEEARRGLELDPYNDAAQSAFGYYLFFGGHADEAAAHLEQFLNRREFLYARVNLANAYAKLGAGTSGVSASAFFNKAFEQARVIKEMESENASRLQPAPAILRYTEELYARLNALTGERAAGKRHLDAMIREMDEGRMSPAVVAEIYTALGEHDRALDLLETAADRRDPGVADIKVNPFLEPLRGSERFKALVKRMHL